MAPYAADYKWVEAISFYAQGVNHWVYKVKALVNHMKNFISA